MRKPTGDAMTRGSWRHVGWTAVLIAMGCGVSPGAARDQEAAGPEQEQAIARIHELEGGSHTR